MFAYVVNVCRRVLIMGSVSAQGRRESNGVFSFAASSGISNWGLSGRIELFSWNFRKSFSVRNFCSQCGQRLFISLLFVLAC